MTRIDPPPTRDRSADPVFARLLADSYARLVGRPLGVPGTVDGLRDAPFALLAHDTAADPRLIYANRKALGCFGYAAADLIGLPSRLTAEMPERAERECLLAAVARNGFVAGYAGVRIAKSGRRFRIEDAVIWNVVDEAGVVHGQAARIDGWRDV